MARTMTACASSCMTLAAMNILIGAVDKNGEGEEVKEGIKPAENEGGELIRDREQKRQATAYCTMHNAASRPAHEILENRLGMMTSHSSQRQRKKQTLETSKSQEQVYDIEVT